MTIIRGTAESGKTVCHTLRLDCCGKQSVQRSLEKSWQRSLTRLLCSRWIIMITTGEKNELATLIGNFNPSWDYEGGSDEAFFQAVSVAGMILENKFERYRGNERADKRVEEVLAKHDPASRILVLPEFIPCQKALSETDIAFVIFPSNRVAFVYSRRKENTR